jgi:hypothetical protein
MIIAIRDSGITEVTLLSAASKTVKYPPAEGSRLEDNSIRLLVPRLMIRVVMT